MLTLKRLEELLANYPTVRIALVGDFFLDKYLDCDRRLSEVSLETGLEAFQVVRVRCYPGAAGTVAANLKALEVGTVYAVGWMGDDGEGYELWRGLERMGVDTTFLFVRSDLLTPTYTKPMKRELDGTILELNRLDIRNRRPLPDDLQTQILQAVEKLLPEVHAVIVADQVPERNWGVITDRVRTTLCQWAAQHSLPSSLVPSFTPTLAPASASLCPFSSSPIALKRRGQCWERHPKGCHWRKRWSLGGSCCPARGNPSS